MNSRREADRGWGYLVVLPRGKKIYNTSNIIYTLVRHHTTTHRVLLLTVLFIGGILLFHPYPAKKALAVPNSDNVSGYAWSENIGWISFNSKNCDRDGDGKADAKPPAPAACPASGTDVADYGVNIDSSGNFTSPSYAWSENIGWVSFNSADVAGCPSTPCAPHLNTATGVVSGWALACSGTNGGNCTGGSRSDGWDGWIHLAGRATDGPQTSYGVSVSGANLGGYAWGSDVVGWIHFFGVVQSNQPTLVIAPPSAEVQVGSSTQLLAFYDSDGTGPVGEIIVTASSTWSSDNSAKASVNNGGTKGLVSGVSAGSANVTANYTDSLGNALSAVAPITVINQIPPLSASCAVSPSSASIGQSVTWTAFPSGGTGSYTYAWSGTDGLSGSGQTISRSYASAGQKAGSVQVTSGSQSVTVSQCGAGATITSSVLPTSPTSPASPASPAPTVAIFANNTSGTIFLSAPANYILTWNTTNADSCTAFGSWSGTKPTSGSEVFSNVGIGAYSYGLFCVNAGGSASGKVGVNVATIHETAP